MARIAVKIDADSSALTRLESEAQRFSSRFRQAFEFTTGAAAFVGIASSIDAIKDGFVDVVKQGVAFNASMQDAQIGVAAVLRQFSPDKFQTFNSAMDASGQAIDALRAKAKQSPATFQELAGAFQGLAGAATASGMSMSQQVDLVTIMSQTLAGLGIKSEQILQESRALITGNITEDAAAARILGITKAQIENATKEGKLYQFLTQKMSGFAEAADVSSQSYTVAVSNMHDATEQLAGELTEPIFEELRKSILEINKTLDSVEFKSAIRPLFDAATEGVKVFAELAQWGLKNATAFSSVAQIMVKLAAAYVAARAVNYAGTKVREAAASRALMDATNAETAAVERNAAAKARAAAHYAEYARHRANGLSPGRSLAAVRGFEGAVTAGRDRLGAGAAAAPIIARGTAGGAMSNVLPLAMIATLFHELVSKPVLKATVGGGYNAANVKEIDDYQERDNGRYSGFITQSREVTTVEEKQRYITALMKAQDELRKEAIGKEGVVRRELEQQARNYELMANSARLINERVMEGNKERMKQEAAKEKKARERLTNAADFEEGNKKDAVSTPAGKMAELQKEIRDLRKNRSDEELRQAREEAMDNAVAAKDVPLDFSPVEKANAEVQAAADKWTAEKAKGEISIGSDEGGASYTMPAGDVEGAKAALDAAVKKRNAIDDAYQKQLAAKQNAVTDNEAEAEKIRKTVVALQEKEAAIAKLIEAQDGLTKASKRTAENLDAKSAEASGQGGKAEAIRRKQEREDFEESLKRQNKALKEQGLKEMDVPDLMKRYDQSVSAARERDQAREREDLEIRKKEAAGDHAGADQIRRKRELTEYRENLDRRGFAPEDQDAMVADMEAHQGADQRKALRRYNLEQKAFDLRAAGKGDEAQKYELAGKRDEMVEQNQRNFGVDEATAGAMADRRLGTEIQQQRTISADRLQKIGGGGGFSSDSKDPSKLLEDIRNILKEIKGNTKPGHDFSFLESVRLPAL